VGVADLPRILNITVPQTGHFPLMALRPFFMVSSTPSAISRLALHLTQYPSGIKNLPPTLHASDGAATYPAQLPPSILKGKPREIRCKIVMVRTILK
jgi:hypothetical protein